MIPPVFAINVYKGGGKCVSVLVPEHPAYLLVDFIVLFRGSQFFFGCVSG